MNKRAIPIAAEDGQKPRFFFPSRLLRRHAPGEAGNKQESQQSPEKAHPRLWSSK
jgi:hypothetical protein